MFLSHAIQFSRCIQNMSRKMSKIDILEKMSKIDILEKILKQIFQENV